MRLSKYQTPVIRAHKKAVPVVTFSKELSVMTGTFVGMLGLILVIQAILSLWGQQLPWSDYASSFWMFMM